jgi:hypothetical protein
MSKRTKSYAAADLVDVDGIKTTFSGETSDHTYVPADLNGAQVLTGGVLDLPRTVTITRASVANAYSTDPIVVTGRRGGDTITDSIAQPNDDGNDTLLGAKLFDVITSIFIPANALGTASFQIGVGDVGAPAGTRFAGIRAHDAGTINVRFGEGTSGAPTDGVPFAAGDLRFDPVQASRVLRTTTIGVTVYI